MIKERDKTPSIVGTPLSLKKWGAGFQKYPKWGIIKVLHRNFEKMAFKKNWKTNVSLSSLSQNLMHFLNVAGIHQTQYGVWWCELLDGVQKWNPKSSSYLKVFKTIFFKKLQTVHAMSIKSMITHPWGWSWIYAKPTSI